MRFSERTGWDTALNPLAQSVKRLKEEGRLIIDLTESNPTRCGFDYLHETLLSDLSSSRNLSYHPDPHGLKPAVEAVLGYYRQKGIRLEPEQIFLTASTSEAYHFIFRLLANPGEYVMAPKPGYPLFDYLAGLDDVKLQPYFLREREGWGLTSRALGDALPEEAPRAIITVNPHNPTGCFLSLREHELLNSFCGENTSALICDEVFFDYSSRGLSPQSLAGNEKVLTFALSGLSKVLGLPQMKLSWIVVNGPRSQRDEAIRRLEIIADAYLPVNTPVQNAAPLWFEKGPFITKEIRGRLQANIAVLDELASQRGAFDFDRPQGGWYLPFRLPPDKSDEQWALELLETKHVLIHPGYLFDFEESCWGVISLLSEAAVFREGVGRALELFFPHPGGSA